MSELSGSANTPTGSSSVWSEFFGLYSVMFPVMGSILAMLPAPASANQMLPKLSEVIPAGLASSVGMLYDENCSVAGLNLTTLSDPFPTTMGIHRLPFPSIAIPDGMPSSGITNRLLLELLLSSGL